MAITTRLGKGSALSHAELDTNFTDLDTRSSDNDIRLTALEGQTLDARVTALEGDTLDARLDVLEGQTLNSRLTVLEGNTLDARLDVLEGQTLDARVTALEGDTLDARLDVLEGQTLDARLTAAESDITVLEQGNLYDGVDVITPATLATGSGDAYEFDASVSNVYSIVAPPVDVVGDTDDIIFEGFVNPVAGQSVRVFIDHSVEGQVNVKFRKSDNWFRTFAGSDTGTFLLSTLNNDYNIIEIIYTGSGYYARLLT